jgi:CheY-like chemotaxis protein
MSTVKNLAIVDDDDIYIYLTKKLIKDLNIVEDVKIFKNGKEILDYLNENISNPKLLPEVIFLDLSMPVMDGWGFLEEYIALKPNIGKLIEIYIISSSISPSDLERARNISIVTDYIIKPITREELKARLCNL